MNHLLTTLLVSGEAKRVNFLCFSHLSLDLNSNNVSLFLSRYFIRFHHGLALFFTHLSF